MTNEPTPSMPSALVQCVDGSKIRWGDCFTDCAGGFHQTQEDREAQDVLVVTELLESIEKGADEYATEHSDYADGYDVCVDENSQEWPAIMAGWVRATYGKYGYRDDVTRFDDCLDKLADHMADNFDGAIDCEVEHNHTDYSSYNGDGCCFFGFKIEELETQIDINDHPALKHLHEMGRLDDVLDCVDREFCIGRDRRREKNEETGNYEEVGRKTYDRGSNYPTLEIYTMPSGGWDFVVSKESMDERFTAAIIFYCNEVDG